MLKPRFRVAYLSGSSQPMSWPHVMRPSRETEDGLSIFVDGRVKPGHDSTAGRNCDVLVLARGA
jgi:hypothetical protein